MVPWDTGRDRAIKSHSSVLCHSERRLLLDAFFWVKCGEFSQSAGAKFPGAGREQRSHRAGSQPRWPPWATERCVSLSHCPWIPTSMAKGDCKSKSTNDWWKDCRSRKKGRKGPLREIIREEHIRQSRKTVLTFPLAAPSCPVTLSQLP